ncbi:MAG TPA: LCP family protein [Streptosporangiaceae bacterium]|jgi:LCP family protein required for cell wall assembly
MSDGWPQGWSRDDPRGPQEERTAVYPQGSYGADPYGGGAPPPGPSAGRVYGGGRSPRPRKRRWPKIVLTVIVIIIVLIAALVIWLDFSLNRTSALVDYSGRPGDTPGTNWLLIGTDSRKGLSRSERDKLATGRAAGQRTDTMMLLHIPEGSDKPTLVSLPRDSWVPIPGHDHNKLNAAFSLGGPQLLVKTIEGVSGIHLDHYMEINFAGFVDVVDAVGGVHMCVKQHLKDPKAGLNLKPGCHDLQGKDALGYVRTRHFANGDLERVKHQRQFVSALMSKATSPGVLLNPFKSIPLAVSGTKAVTVDDGDHIWNMISLAQNLGGMSTGKLVTTSVPLGGFGTSPTAGSYIIWQRQRALELFNALKNDQPVPSSALQK